MAELKNQFHKNKMNKDADSRFIEKGAYVDALNIESNDSGVLANSLSNKKLTNLSLGNNPITIGMYFDSFEDKIYWFVKSDSGDFIIEFQETSNIAVIVL